MSSGSIKPIDTASVHRIHSGQVVLDLQGAVKELLENAFDAGATSVEVRIKDNGLESIEVVDNGSGIDQADWPSIGLKHHTSKLPSLEQLAQVSTFGFRGEALSALCALCESVTVTTATTETAPMGAVITLGRDGRVVDDTGRVARQRGTTITLSGLFKPLPVRRKEFERTVKREFTKALGILNAYALVPAAAAPAQDKTGVRLRVEVIGSGRGGKRSTILTTDGRGTLRSSANAVWGPKALEGVVDLDIDVEVEVDKAMARREGIEETSQTIRVRGLISSGAWGQGRSSTDRQFTYINGRPCTLPKIMKAINEVYKSFNTNQHPLAILDFEIPRESVDINVSPDKRTIFVHSEANLVEALKRSLEEFFQPTRSTYAVHGASTTVKLVQGENGENAEEETLEDAQDDTPGEPSRAASDAESEGESELSQHVASRHTLRHGSSPPSVRSSAPPRTRLIQQSLDTSVASWSQPQRLAASSSSRTRTAPPVAITRAPSSGRQARTDLRQRLSGFASQPVPQVDLTSDASDQEDESEVQEETPEAQEDELEDNDVEMVEEAPAPAPRRAALPATAARAQRATRRRYSPEPPAEIEDMEDEPENGVPALQVTEVEPVPDTVDVAEPTAPVLEAEPNLASRSASPDLESQTPIPNFVADVEEHMDVDAPGYRNEIQYSGATGEVTLKFDMARLRSRLASRCARRSASSNPSGASAFTALANGTVTKAAGVGNRDAGEAEAALARVIRKDDFEHMQVLGQFNKGFIIARLAHPADGAPATDDLFIVDQHASDEKYNFETLQRTTVIKAQALIRPRRMQLTAADEIAAMENMDILHANGFDVAVDEDAAPGRGERISLKAMPISKETTFDFKDLEQLLHLLSDSARPAGQMVRCTKARSMFAMRACRRSVMIGKSLTKAQMVTLLRNMGTIDQPWNCPHGRPTMRHLCSLTLTTLGMQRTSRIDWGHCNLTPE